MIHARPEYNRFQEPDNLLKWIKKLHRCLQYGENLSDQEEMELINVINEYDDVLKLRGSMIAVDEPVLLFRAQDIHFQEVLNHYFLTVQSARKHDKRIIDQLSEHFVKAESWRYINQVKLPDSVG